MTHEEELYRYESDAEDDFDDYDEEYEDDFDTGFEGLDEDDYDEEYEYIDDEDDYDNYSASSIGKIDPNDRTLTVIVTNKSDTEEHEAIVFGANQNPTLSPDITIDVSESSHNEVKEDSKSNPFTIMGMKMSVTDELQFNHVLSIHQRSARGKKSQSVFQPTNAISPQNQTTKIIDSQNFEMDVTGEHSLRFKVRPKTTVVFTFTIKAKVSMKNLLEGQNVAEISTTPRTTGLPQLDAQHQKVSKPFGLRKRVKVKRVVKKKPSRRRGRRRGLRRLRRRR